MGAGDAPAGHTPAGLGAQTLLPPYVPGGPPAAIKLDTRARDAVLDADGKFEDMGTIEQQVAIAFGYARGSLKHAPNVGHDFLTLPRTSRANLDAEIDRRARVASPFDQLLAAGTVELVSVVKQHPKKTETRIAITWRKTGDTSTRITFVGNR